MPANILLIEDDGDLRTEILEYLLRHHHRVSACDSIVDAREFLQNLGDDSLAPDIVVSDIKLTDGDGISFYIEQARRFPHVKWILMSGNHDLVRLGNDYKDLSGLPGCTIVDKPIPLRLLGRVIDDAERAA